MKDLELLAIRASKFGMSLDEYIRHIREHGSSGGEGIAMSRYVAQMSAARRRGIAWKFTFPTWWEVWLKSGKWDERGRLGYVMARVDDGDTPYSPATVYICTQSQNIRDSFINNPHPTRKKPGMPRPITVGGESASKFGPELARKYRHEYGDVEVARAAYIEAFVAAKP